MNWKRTARWSWLILPFLLLALWPAVAAAGPIIPPGSNAVLYEVTENLKLKPLQANRRVATAALMGTVDGGTAICPSYLFPVGTPAEFQKCALTAMASDNISLVTGKGPVVGTFSVVVQDPNAVDGPELVILRGHFSGKIDLSAAISGAAPLGSMSGKWSARGVAGGPLQGVHARGSLTGTFRLPVDFGGGPLYVTPGFGPGAVPVDALEHSLGIPTVRLEVSFVTE